MKDLLRDENKSDRWLTQYSLIFRVCWFFGLLLLFGILDSAGALSLDFCFYCRCSGGGGKTYIMFFTHDRRLNAAAAAAAADDDDAAAVVFYLSTTTINAPFTLLHISK